MRKSTVFVCAAFALGAAGLAARGQQENAREGRHGQDAAHAQGIMKADREVAIGHALCMAVEGSNLWSCAQEVRAQSGLRGATRGAAGAASDPAIALEKHARDGFAESRKLFQAVQNDRAGGQNTGQQRFMMASMRYALALESMTQGGAAGTGTGIGTGRETGIAPGATDREAPAVPDPAEGSGKTGRRRGGPQDEGQDARASTPRVSGAVGSGRGDAQVGEAASTPRGQAIVANMAVGVENKGQVALLNHAVKESVEACMLRKMLRNHDDNDQTAQALRSHANMMLQGSNEALAQAEAAGSGTIRRESARPANEQFNRGAAAPKAGAGASVSAGVGNSGVGASANIGGTTVGASANLARPGAAVSLEQNQGAGRGGDLVALAREVIESVQALDQEGDQGGAGLGNRGATGRDSGNSPTTEKGQSDGTSKATSGRTGSSGDETKPSGR